MLLPPWEERVVGGAAHAADQERRIAVPGVGVGVGEGVLGPGGGTRIAQDITGVLGFVVDLPDIGAELHGMRAGHLGYAALQLIRIGVVVALAAPQTLIAVEAPPAEIDFV